jgi:hypothetical protein
MLASDHPTWQAISNPYNRQRLPSSWDSRDWATRKHEMEPGEPWIRYRYGVYTGPPDRGLMFPELRALFDLNFPFKEAVWDIISDRLRIHIGRTTVTPEGDKTSGSFASSSIIHDDNPDFQFVIQLSADMLWPLISPVFSDAEKLQTSLMIASTIVHELAVGYSHIAL